MGQPSPPNISHSAGWVVCTKLPKQLGTEGLIIGDHHHRESTQGGAESEIPAPRALLLDPTQLWAPRAVLPGEHRSLGSRRGGHGSVG